MAERSRGTALTIFALLFVLLAISDFAKPLSHSPGVGFVFMGVTQSGTPNDIMGPLFGICLLAYAYGIWNLRAWVLPLSIAYAFYVPANMVLFWSLHRLTPPSHRFILMYLFLSLGGSVGTAIYLSYHRERLS